MTGATVNQTHSVCVCVCVCVNDVLPVKLPRLSAWIYITLAARRLFKGGGKKVVFSDAQLTKGIDLRGWHGIPPDH